MVETNLVGTATVGLGVAVLGEGLAPVPQPTSGTSRSVIPKWAHLIGSAAFRLWARRVYGAHTPEGNGRRLPGHRPSSDHAAGLTVRLSVTKGVALLQHPP